MEPGLQSRPAHDTKKEVMRLNTRQDMQRQVGRGRLSERAPSLRYLSQDVGNAQGKGIEKGYCIVEVAAREGGFTFTDSL